jgi:hypothetical protein
MDDARELLEQVEASRAGFRTMLSRIGLDERSLEAFAADVGRRLPPAERQRVDDAIRRFVPQKRLRAGSSRLAIPTGIRG